MFYKIGKELLNEMSEKSKIAKRKRAHFIFHKLDGDPIQRMLNAMQPNTYIQPHKHEDPDKREVFMALTGKLIVVIFDHLGNITDYMILDPSKQEYAIEIPARTFHTIICLEPDSIAYEIKDGPYNPIDDKNFASWAPKEGDQGCNVFNKKILGELGIQKK